MPPVGHPDVALPVQRSVARPSMFSYLLMATERDLDDLDDLVSVAASADLELLVVAVVHSSATGDLVVVDPRHSVAGSAVLAPFHGGHGPQEGLLVGLRGQVRPEFERIAFAAHLGDAVPVLNLLSVYQNAPCRPLAWLS